MREDPGASGEISNGGPGLGGPAPTGPLRTVRGRLGGAAAAGLVLFGSLPLPVLGQASPAPPPAREWEGIPALSSLAVPSGFPPSGMQPGSSWTVVGASALVPGVGQLLSGQRRGWLYLAAESAIWIGYGVERSRGRADRRGYRDLAWEVARAGTAGSRMDGDFEYYERLSQWARSGAFDADGSAPGIQPEQDPTTFNGNAWRLAGAIFGGGGAPGPGEPGYEEALAYYRERAYGESFLWDWTAAPEAQERFRGLIDSSDTHLGRASLLVGAALLNHLASGLDALFSRRGMAASVRMRHRALVPGLGPQAVLHFQLLHP